ncbi:MAG TPA: YggT family protein [Burkholderiales bacterium]|nr:YggT family protein [Burkholderiales bacterium]
MLNQILTFLLETFLGLFALALLLRFWLQTMRAPARNPVSTFLAALTNWIVIPARRVVPGLRGIDLSTLLLAWLTKVVLLAATLALRGLSLGMIAVLVFALFDIVRLSLYILMFAVIAQAVLTWVAPYSPAMPVLNSLVRPFLAPFQRRIPTIGNVDISPIFLLVVIQILIFIVNSLQGGMVRT